LDKWLSDGTNERVSPRLGNVQLWFYVLFVSVRDGKYIYMRVYQMHPTHSIQHRTFQQYRKVAAILLEYSVLYGIYRRG